MHCSHLKIVLTTYQMTNKFAPTGFLLFPRSYSRFTENGRETWEEAIDRCLDDLAETGRLTAEEKELVKQQALELKALPSGRWLWIGGTDWIKKPENHPGAFNCTSTEVEDWRSLADMMELAMMGAGTGAVLEEKNIGQLPVIRNELLVRVLLNIGEHTDRKAHSSSFHSDNYLGIEVGDSRQGWVQSLLLLLEAATDRSCDGHCVVEVDLGNVRPKGEKLNGFGGIANPAKLPELYGKVAGILNRAIGRKLTSVEVCLIADEAALVVVAGNVRRSAGIRQFSESDTIAAAAKDNLWIQDESGKWKIDPDRDALRMANHSRVFHHKPTLDELKAAVAKQYYSGEGAIQYAPEAIARASADLLKDDDDRITFIELYINDREKAKQFLAEKGAKEDLEHRMLRYGLNPCGEIVGSNFFCNLSEVHLNTIDTVSGLKRAFQAAALNAAALLHLEIVNDRYKKSREWDPIVGVSFTGLFDFFVNSFGVDWLKWWKSGRSMNYHGANYYKDQEEYYLSWWRSIVEETIEEYCDRHNLKMPNRCTTVQPSGSKSLLTGASPGWHPPKAQRYIRRMTFAKNDPIALACLDYGYSIVPSQSDKDENGRLLNDPFDPRCTEWLVEIPVEVPWANLPGVEEIDISQFSVLAQFDFYMQVQKFYVGHNCSATFELREHEIDEFAEAMYEAIDRNEGYISGAILARFDDKETYPRLPFEPISKEMYDGLVTEVKQRRKDEDFMELLKQYDRGIREESGPSGCDSDKCLLPVVK